MLGATGQTDLRLHRQAVAGQRRRRGIDPAGAQGIQPQCKGADPDRRPGRGQGVDGRSRGFPVSGLDRSLGTQKTAEQRAFVMLGQVSDGGALLADILGLGGEQVGGGDPGCRPQRSGLSGQLLRLAGVPQLDLRPGAECARG